MLIESFDDAVAPDLRQYFGIDPYSDETRRRPWWWLRKHCMALLNIPESRYVLALREETTVTQ